MPLLAIQYVFNTYGSTESRYRNISRYGFARRYSPLDQSLRCRHEETLGPLLPSECSEDSDQTVDAQADLSLRWAQSFCWFCHEVAQIVFKFVYLVPAYDSLHRNSE